MTLRDHFPWLAFLVILGSAEQALPATLFVTSPQFGICVTSEDAHYQYHWGALQPEAGQFSFSPLGQAPLAPHITVPQDAMPGDLLHVSVEEPEDVDSVTAQILGPKQQTISRGIGFRPKAQQKDEWVILVGVPNVTTKGSYTLSLTATAGARNVLNLSSLSLRARTFRFERIIVTPDMEKIHTSQDPRMIAEAREFVRIITTAHPDAVFELGTIRNPLPDARRTSGYGDRRKFLYPDNSSDYSVHEGLDLADPSGTPVPACGRGRVVLAAERIVTGNTVVVEMLPGLFSCYFHLSEIDVKEGDIIQQGDLIGKVGMTGFATGPHLHWELDALGVAVDPDALTSGAILDKTVESGEIENAKAPKGGE
jgi:murein DD-endopeptidase MepM/ murein hydrolase activator NlpD